MSRYHPRGNTKYILPAAEHWRRSALESDGSVFTDEAALWGEAGIAGLQKHYLEALEWGEGSYMDKLEVQLVDAPPVAIMLAAEMHWFMSLPSTNLRPSSKREQFEQIWRWSGTEPDMDSQWLFDEVLLGVGSTGTAYSINKWREFQFFIRFIQAFKDLAPENQRNLLNDPWAMGEWIADIEEADKRQLRHVILYMLFPDHFEQIFSAGDRRQIVAGFLNLNRKEVNKLSALDLDRRIYDIRKEQEELRGTTELFFYESPLFREWHKRTFKDITADLEPDHVEAAIKRIRTDGIPNDARSTTYDLVHESERFPPKYVLSLAVEEASGEPYDRAAFDGGESSQCFKLLRKLGFQIEKKTLLADLLRDFVAQADKQENLAVSSYPKRYRGLDLNVFFGKGTKVPWITFTGYEQKTTLGIFPVVLYYQSVGRLIVSFGISESYAPESLWSFPARELQTIDQYFQSELGLSPECYGTSLVRSVFDVSQELDIDASVEAVDAVITEFHRQMSGGPGGGRIEDPGTEDYGISEALDGLFIEEDRFKEILELLRRKKNIILQGPPGVGKTFVCKRLAFALMQQKAPDRLGMVQFHQSYAYEDFIQGYRPDGKGFQLRDGVFHQFCTLAINDPTNDYVFIIDEINRGNLSKVFGELMMLVESDKRGEDWAIPLTYSKGTDDKFYIPENLYLVGLMNTADRSLAMVDYALRRRFGFVDLPPGFETPQFEDFLRGKGAPKGLIRKIGVKLGRLNDAISDDKANLGRGFCIGHSYFCAISENEVPDDDWYEQIVRTEIGPLLHEYWFDNPGRAETLTNELLI